MYPTQQNNEGKNNRAENEVSIVRDIKPTNKNQ
jgi:hypothetical protein